MKSHHLTIIFNDNISTIYLLPAIPWLSKTHARKRTYKKQSYFSSIRPLEIVKTITNYIPFG